MHFHADDRVRDAAGALAVAQAAPESQGGHEHVEACLSIAQLWHTRVVRWRDLQRQDLFSHGIPVPGATGRRWLLYRHGADMTVTDKDISCFFCEECVEPLSRRRSNGTWALNMPPFAVARGLWQGPEPEEIRMLTYVERRILRLARADVCVKRVSSHVTPWSGANEAARPQYSTRNVVAFSEDPDAVVQACCIEPSELGKYLHVQYDGTDGSSMLGAPSLQVDISRLRTAMFWFASRNWQWLEATKEHSVLSIGMLGARLEHVLAEYTSSLCGVQCGVPKELRDGAACIPVGGAPLHHEGPAQALAGLNRVYSAFRVCVFKSRVFKSRAYWVVWDRRTTTTTTITTTTARGQRTSESVLSLTWTELVA